MGPLIEPNQSCFCVSLDQAALRQAIEMEIGHPGLFELIQQRCPHLFSAWPVFISAQEQDRMSGLIEAVESVVVMPSYREKVLSWAPEIAQHDPKGVLGVFFGYDFHVTQSGHGLIEINTNAGGAMLNAVLARAQRACCPPVAECMPTAAGVDALEDEMVAMFRQEWELTGRGRPLRTIAIVDEAPQEQYLYPEFLLFQSLFERNGLRVVITDPAELRWSSGMLWHGDETIDLVYNRLTDFALMSPAHAHLREAYLSDGVVLTPHPRAHALYADKRNLAVLSDAQVLLELGVPASTRAILQAGIPRTVLVTSDNADSLWLDRRHWFFKPFAGYGSRATYRGDKLTQRVWQEILAGGYVAQALVRPGERVVADMPQPQVLKFDLREYVYNGRVQSVAARMYQGQTTNFRTPGGGFAPVFKVTNF